MIFKIGKAIGEDNPAFIKVYVLHPFVFSPTHATGKLLDSTCMCIGLRPTTILRTI